jgi:hypothetical protein
MTGCDRCDPPVRRLFSLPPTTERPDEGPVHAMYDRAGLRQAWCGTRPQFRHWVRDGDAAEVTCRKCLTGLRRGRPYARGSR